MNGPTTRLITVQAERKGVVGTPRRVVPWVTRRRGLWAMAAGVAVVLVLGGADLMWRNTNATAASGHERTATVVRGNFLSTLRLSGTSEAIETFPILAPRLAGEPAYQLTIVRLVSNGARVKRGDLLVEFDRQNEIKSYLDNGARYLALLNQIAKQQATDSAARAKDETDVHTAEDQLKTAQLEMQKLEVLSLIDQKKTRNQLEEAQASLKELQQTFKLRREEAAAGMRDLELQRDQAHRDMIHAQLNEERMAIHSPIDGVVVLHSIWKSGQFAEVQEGDQIRPGLGFMEVVDPSEMQVQAKAGQMDVLGLHPGQPAEVRLDAYPGMVLPATLETISPIGSPGQFSGKVRTFTVTFSVQAHDARLMPDLSAAVDVQLDQKKDVLLIPKDCLYVEQGQAFVRVRKGLTFEKRAVALGPENSLEVVVRSGLNTNDVVERGVFGG
jgi:HlyD family secretion protein